MSIKDEELIEKVYQVDDPISSRMVIDTDIPPTLVLASRKVDIIQSLSHCMERTSEAAEDEEEEVLRYDVQFENNEESPKPSDYIRL